MNRSTENVWLHAFACALAVATLFLVALGAIVTTKAVGMAVPDWPTTYGEHMFLFPPSKWMAGIFDEHSHRLWASLVGLLAAVFAIWTWARCTTGKSRWLGIAAMITTLGLMGVRTPAMFVVMAFLALLVLIYAGLRAVDATNRLRWLGVITFAAVIIQGVLGGLRVLLDEHGWGGEFGIFHAILAQLFFLLVCSLGLITSKWWRQADFSTLSPQAATALRRLLVATSFLILLQLLLGATMRHQHAGLAVPDFPLAYGKVWPATDAASIAAYNAQRLEAAGENAITAPQIIIHMLHRITACAVLAAIIGCAVQVWRHTTKGAVLRKISAVWVLMVLVQVTLGILTILSQRKVDVTTAHVAVGALTFMTGWLQVLISSRSLVRTAETVPETARIVSCPGSLTHA